MKNNIPFNHPPHNLHINTIIYVTINPDNLEISNKKSKTSLLRIEVSHDLKYLYIHLISGLSLSFKIDDGKQFGSLQQNQPIALLQNEAILLRYKPNQDSPSLDINIHYLDNSSIDISTTTS